MRRLPSRSKRRSRSTGFLAMVSTRLSGTAMPAFAASARATASHTTVLISSSLRGNFAIARWPSFSMTDAFGRAPPSDDPGANSRRRSSSVSFSSMTCSAAESSFGSSTSGGMRLTPSSRRNGPPSLFGKAQRALARLVVHQQQEVDFLKCARRGALALRAPSFHPAHQRPSPPVRRRVADRAEHRRIGRRVERAGAELQGRLQREPRGMFEPAFVVFESGAFLVLAHAGPQPPHQVGNAVQVHVHKGFFVHHLSFVRFCLRAPRMRCGRFSSSSCRPTGSFFGAARSPSRSAMPST